MTAIVGILNKHGIAIAADSAETIGNGIKIYNKANKIFNLSKYNPIGAAVYGSANFNDLTPWDIIFKLYREHIGKKVFPKVSDYASDFISFIEDKSFFSEKEELESALCSNILSYFNEYIIINRICQGNHNNLDLKKLPEILTEIQNDFKKLSIIESLHSVSKEDFLSSINPALKQIKQILIDNNYDYSSIETKLKDVLYISFTHKENLHSHSGVSIFGYGNDEIYPRLHRLKIYGVICGKLKWYVEEICEVSNNQNAFICPMAQSDVMLTILRGIEPKLQQCVMQLTEQLLNENVKQIADVVKRTDKGLAHNISAINIKPTHNMFMKAFDECISNNHVSPLIQTIAILQKEDLAEVAENLIYLTSLIRRITPDKESVGGPIDVALLSKGDGFIWIKRKHYFEESLNKNYFGKYYIDNENSKMEASHE